MTGEESRPAGQEPGGAPRPPAAPARPGGEPAPRQAGTPSSELSGDDPADDIGGDSACWAHLVCPECGAIVAEGHREGCALGQA